MIAFNCLLLICLMIVMWLDRSLNTSAATTTSAFDFYVGKNHVRLVAPEKQWVTICSAQGQVMYHKELQGNETVTLPHGVYVINKQKVVIP